MQLGHTTPQAKQDTAKLEQEANGAEGALETLRVTPTKSAAADTQAAVSAINRIGGHPAVVGQIEVDGQKLDTLLSTGSFETSRVALTPYAESLGGYRVVTRGENRAYVEDLLAKEEKGTINDAEKEALKTYRERYMRDTEGGLEFDDHGVSDRTFWRDFGFRNEGALFVRASKVKVTGE